MVCCGLLALCYRPNANLGYGAFHGTIVSGLPKRLTKTHTYIYMCFSCGRTVATFCAATAVNAVTMVEIFRQRYN